MPKKLILRFAKVFSAVVLSAGLFAGVVPAPIHAANIKDISKAAAYSKDAVQWMVNNNVITGDQYGYFNPTKKISRAELVTIIVKALNIDTTNLPTTPTYSDVPVQHWAYKYVEAASRAGIISGTGNGMFGISGLSTREQVTMILLNSLSVSKEAVLAAQGLDGLSRFSDLDNMSDWAKASIQFAVSNNIMSGTGTNTFSPSGKATKEQIAVILYNFLTNKNNINRVADQLRRPIITFNGDIIKLNGTEKIINGEILVPTDAFAKIGLKVIIDETKSNILIKNLSEEKNIYFQVGSKVAYVNYTGNENPFTASEAVNNSINIPVAPELTGEEILIPVKTVATALGMSCDLNPKTGLVTIKDAAEVNNPMVYNALKDMLDYKGEYKTSMNMIMFDTVNKEEIMSIKYIMQGANNGLNSTAKTTVTAYDPLNGDEIIENEVVKIGQTLYSKDIATGRWSQITEEEAVNQGIMYYDSEADKAETQKLLDAYGKFNIFLAGKSVLNGEEVTRYQIKAGKEMINGLVPSDMLDGLSISDIYNKGFNMVVDMYLNNKGQLVKQVLKLTAGIEQNGFGMDLNLTNTAEFSNIGKSVEIASPV